MSVTAPAVSPQESPAAAGNRSRALLDYEQPIWRLVLLLALPVMAQQLLHLAVMLSDSFLAGNFLELSPDQNVAGQAAQTTANYLYWFISSFTVLVSAGSTALVARFKGAHDRAGAVRATHQSILLALLFGASGSLLGLSFMEELLNLLQLRGEAAAMAAAYLWPIFLALPLQMVETVGIACLQGAGDTVTGMWIMSGVTLLNLPLAWGFFKGLFFLPAMGFIGISSGTAVSHALGCVAVLCVLALGRADLFLRPRLLRPDPRLIRRLLRISIPAGIDSLSVVIGQFWFLSIINRLGAVASAAHGIALRWEALGYLSGNAFQVAAMTLVGQCLGARRPDLARRSGWVAFALGGSVMCMMAVVFFVLAEPMFGLFCPRPEQRAIIDAGVPVLQLVAFGMAPCASCIIFTGALRGAGDTRVPVLFTWIGFLGIRIPLAYWLTSSAGWGLLGAWWAMLADLVVRGSFFLVRFAAGRWQSIRV
jgi:putative MATE family efflux protein